MKLRHCFQRAAAVMACLMLFCNVASAAGTARPSYKELTGSQLGEKCSLTLTYKKDNTALPQTGFTLYKVADMDRNIHFELTEQFEPYRELFAGDGAGNLKINEQDFNAWNSIANTLSGYVARDGAQLTPAAQGSSDAQGEVSFSGLEVGLYLLVGERTSAGQTYYTPNPSLLALPSWNGETDDWDFVGVQGSIKFTENTVPVPGVTTVERRALKVWNDEGNEASRPAEVVVDLLQNGEVYESATLNAANNWRAEWTDLSADAQWQLVERLDSERYTVSIEQQGVTFVVTNTFVQDIDDPTPPTTDEPGGSDDPDPAPPTTEIDDPNTPTTDNPGIPDNPGDPDPGTPEEPVTEIDDPDVPLADLPDLPQTGQLWWPVPLLAVGGVAMILVGLVRRRNGSCDG